MKESETRAMKGIEIATGKLKAVAIEEENATEETEVTEETEEIGQIGEIGETEAIEEDREKGREDARVHLDMTINVIQMTMKPGGTHEVEGEAGTPAMSFRRWRGYTRKEGLT